MKLNRSLSFVFVLVSSIFADTLYLNDDTRETFGSNNAEQSELKEMDARIKYGIRIALGIFGKHYNFGNIDLNLVNGDGGGDPTYGNLNLEAGWLIGIPIYGSITFNPSLSLIYRSPLPSPIKACADDCIEILDLKVTEFAVSVPVLVRGMPFGGPMFYIDGGIQVDFPFYSKVEVSFLNDAVSFDINNVNIDRNMDIGIIFGMGWFVGKNLAIDFKLGVSVKGDEDFVQTALGVNYWL